MAWVGSGEVTFDEGSAIQAMMRRDALEVEEWRRKATIVNRAKATPRYSIRTWDTESQSFTPQEGVPSRHLTLFQLRQAMRELRKIGYPCDRNKDGSSDPSVLVEREE